MSRAWFKFYGRDFRDGVRDLAPDVVGVYTILLTLMYEEEGGRIRDHDQRLCRLIGCDIRMWRRVRSTLIQAGKIHVAADGFLTNDRVEIEQRSAEHLSEVRAISGRSSRQLTVINAAKPRKTNDPPEANAPNLPLYARALPESESEEESSLRSLSVSPKAKSARKTTINLEAPLSDEGRAYAAQHGILNGNADAVYAHFRDHHHTKGNRFIDWDAAWRNWVRRQPQFAAKGAAGAPQQKSFSTMMREALEKQGEQ